MRTLHLTNSEGRNTTVPYVSRLPEPPPKLGVAGLEVTLRRYLAATDAGLHAALAEKMGEDYGQALVDGDPEVDLEQVGRRIGETATVYLSAAGEVLYAAPRVVEVITGADGEERERRAPVDVEANINDEQPIRYTGRKIPRRDVVRKFVFKRALQLQHVDGLTYDYLYAIAKELDEEEAVVLMGGGKKGKEPLVFQVNGSPYRGFLEGRIDGPRYQLLLHLSNMELKRPGGGQ